MNYYVSYGPEHTREIYRTESMQRAGTLKQARALARKVSQQVLCSIDIVADGKVVETLTPKISKSGRVTFTRKARKA